MTTQLTNEACCKLLAECGFEPFVRAYRNDRAVLREARALQRHLKYHPLFSIYKFKKSVKCLMTIAALRK